MLRTTDVVRRLYEDLFEAHGITLQQYNVLRILCGAAWTTSPKRSRWLRENAFGNPG